MFTVRTRQWIQSLILLLLGMYFLDNMLSGRIYFYINERFGWLSWIATGIFLVLGITGVFDLFRTSHREAEHDHAEHDHDHAEHDHHDHDDHELLQETGHEGHNHGAAASWPVLALVAVPLVLGVIVPAKPLGASAVGTSGVSTSFNALQAGGGSATQLSVASTDRNVLDWVRAFNGSSNVDEFNAQPADMIGFVYRDIRFKDQPLFMVARFTISCCVADASAIGVIVQSDQAAKLAPDSWVHIKGKFQSQQFDGAKTPILVADSIEPTNQPDHPYLYP
ncbi:MAG: TIGR03943 family protein [Chloroflexota bacterium]